LAKILDMLQNESYKIKAEEIAEKMKKEDFKNSLYNAIVR